MSNEAALPPEPGPSGQTYTFNLYADYLQFNLGDSRFDGDTGAPDFWSEEALDRRLAISPPSLLGVATNLYDNVAVVVKVGETPSEFNDDIDAWDHVVEASLEIPSGSVAIDGCLAYRPVDLTESPAGDEVSPKFAVRPGAYRARVYSRGLGSEAENYRIVMWPAPYASPVVLRKWTDSRIGSGDR